MKLVIDVGNTRTKLAVFSSQTLIYVNAVEALTVGILNEIIEKFPSINKAIYSVVGLEKEDIDIIKEFLKSKFELIEMSNDLITPISNKYLTPETLGQDRIAAVVGVNNLFAGSNCLVIDAGTCITIDYIDSESNYHGGSISPGINMKYRALNNFTSKLPLLSGTNEKEIIGEDTISSIKSGVLNGTLMELEGFISYYNSEKTDLKVVITGGDAKFIHNNIKETILEEHLVLYGLNIILDTNVKK